MCALSSVACAMRAWSCRSRTPGLGGEWGSSRTRFLFRLPGYAGLWYNGLHEKGRDRNMIKMKFSRRAFLADSLAAAEHRHVRHRSCHDGRWNGKGCGEDRYRRARTFLSDAVAFQEHVAGIRVLCAPCRWRTAGERTRTLCRGQGGAPGGRYGRCRHRFCRLRFHGAQGHAAARNHRAATTTWPGRTGGQ